MTAVISLGVVVAHSIYEVHMDGAVVGKVGERGRWQ